MTKQIIIYDTTLRDGTQGEQVNLSAEDKLRIARKLDEFGVQYVEGGWPGSNPKDARFFEMAKKEAFHQTRLTAFGSTRGAQTTPEKDKNLKALLQTEVETVAIFGKSWDFHASRILGVGLDENINMIYSSVEYLKKMDRHLIYDAEHFFDGFKNNSGYALKTLEAAATAGADILVLCDTNGGTMPEEISEIIKKVSKSIKTPLGIHTHNDYNLTLTNSLAGVRTGAAMVQGTINGYGERCGNVDLISVMANLELKMGYKCIADQGIKRLTELSRFVSEVANIPPLNQRPFVGKSAFAHKGGVHVSAILKDPLAYEHITPEQTGNRRRVLVSDLAGKSNIEYKTREMGIKLGGKGYNSQSIVREIKKLEDQGYEFDAAEGSLELMIKKVTGQFDAPFVLESFRVTTEKDRDQKSVSHATIKISVGEDHEITAAEGDGPVSALDNAMRKALTKFFPQIQEMGLVDFKVRVIEGTKGTASRVRVQIESRDSREIWSTIGVSENIIEASWQALSDSMQYKLSK